MRGLAARLRSTDPTLRVLDLACGTGANLRELAPRLGGSQRWVLVDHDPVLLAALSQRFAEWARDAALVVSTTANGLRIEGADWDAEVISQRLDLAASLDAAPFRDAQLITASALIDLVSQYWLDALLNHARAANAALLLALSVDGRVEWEPRDADDGAVLKLFEMHQRRDKGFGPALGIGAPGRAASRLQALGYQVSQARSDWLVGPGSSAMQIAMIEGLAGAAMEQDPAARERIDAWKLRRLAIAAVTSLRVGHTDLLAMHP
ncbi:class I SAM-dependent methyltransferase [Variovorax sp. J22R133]|uniref:class I SAM-dependent methyltransferase n=1 Tax=Variovorax brevis TaxID=3053503 RepID=UPI0025772FEE|nr:class I SAM-dependent methyltransferase [Variovorax sp. J22R133]MDM0111213.1 class I SAM-dependent methyltransferase [Variovorax sp. J22R133]